VQWCHGAPGLIPTMLKAEEALGGGGRYLAAARRAAEVVWQRGLLTKVGGPGWPRQAVAGAQGMALALSGASCGASNPTLPS
jgi:hypothetical protein